MSEDVKESLDFSAQFDEELGMINDEIAAIDGLYTETKQHFDTVKNSNNRSVLGFIEKQTSNLVSIRGTKISLIKEKIGIKKTMAEFDFKKANLDKSSGAMSEGLTKQLFDMISNNANNHVPSETTVYNPNDDDIDAQLDAQFDNLVEQGDIDLSEVNTIVGSEGILNASDEQEISEIEYEIVVDTEGKFFALTENEQGELNILDDVDLSQLKVVNMFEDNEITYAEANDGNIYEVVEFE